MADFSRTQYSDCSYLNLESHGQIVRLSAADLALLIRRLIRDGQLQLLSPGADWCYGEGEIDVQLEEDGSISVRPDDGRCDPVYTVALPEPYVDADGRVCNPFGC